MIELETGRPVTMAPRGLVTSPHALASAAGVEILKAGGSAVDAAVATAAALAVQAQQGVSVNGVGLDAQTLAQLQAAYGAIAPGRYWYDPVSGLRGRERGPHAGQIRPGLRLGGALQRTASGGGTGVVINGREIHPSEMAELQQLFETVKPGRYWLNAQGIGGYEGGPAQFNLPAAAAQRSGGGRGYNRSGPGGHLMSDGNCFGYMAPNGSSVMSGSC